MNACPHQSGTLANLLPKLLSREIGVGEINSSN